TSSQGPQAATVTGPAGRTAPAQPEKRHPRRFHGSVLVDPTRFSRDAAKIAEEVLQHLTSLVGADVSVTVEIQANVASGVPDDTVRTVTENCRTLKFQNFGFEED